MTPTAFLWLSVGGKSQLGDKVEVLEGRRIVAFPDLDAHDAWVEKIEERPHLGIQISDLLVRNATPEDFARGYDIADFIIRQFQSRCHPERSEGSISKPTHSSVMPGPDRASQILNLVPEAYRSELSSLITDFDLVLVNHTQFKSLPS